MANRTDFLSAQPEGLFKLEGFEADDGVFLRHEGVAAEFVDDLDDILWEMDSPSFDGEDWINDDFGILAVLGASEDGWIVQPQVFLLHSNASDSVHVLEMAPPMASTFEELPKITASLDELSAKIRR